MFLHKLPLYVILGGAAFLIAPSHAQNLVADGGFEQADPIPNSFGSYDTYFAGDSFDAGDWTVSDGTIGIDNNDSFVLDGTRSLDLTPTMAGGSVEQTLATTPGQTYTISVIAAADGANAFYVGFDGASLTATTISVPQNGFPGFQRYTYTATASSSSTALDLIGDAPFGHTLEVDDVSVLPSPEPSSMIVLACGALSLGILGLRARRTN